MNDDLDALLALEQVGTDRFQTVPAGAGHLFGGYTLALAVRAAAATVPGHLAPHSLHASFLDPGTAGRPLTLDVARLRDGRSFAVRQVTVRQDSGVPLSLTVSFHGGEAGTDWHDASYELPLGPDSLIADIPRLGSIDPVEIRPVGPVAHDGLPRLHPYWARPRIPLPDEPFVHAAAVALVSDFMVVTSAQVPGSAAPTGSLVVTLNHAIWFHRPVRFDDWLLFTAEPMSVAAARGVARGSVVDIRGGLVASFVQEALTRPPRGEAPRA